MTTDLHGFTPENDRERLLLSLVDEHTEAENRLALRTEQLMGERGKVLIAAAVILSMLGLLCIALLVLLFALAT